jgi:hypothetical protein
MFEDPDDFRSDAELLRPPALDWELKPIFDSSGRREGLKAADFPGWGSSAKEV